MHHIYSPLPSSDYHITILDHCEVSSIEEMAQPESFAIWNLFWLTVPQVDALPIFGKRPDWSKHYMPVEGAMHAVIVDATADAVMHYKLLMRPSQFLDWFLREDHTQYQCYLKLGGQSWVDTVIARASLAVIHANEAAMSQRANNVLLFRKKTA